jgi:hypothetical protein
MKVMVEVGTEHMLLFGNQYQSKANEKTFQTFAKQTSEALQKYTQFFEFKSVNVVIQPTISPRTVREKLIHHKELSVDDLATIAQVMENTYNVPEGDSTYVITHLLQLRNPVHATLMLSMLINAPEMLSAFYPLTEYPIQWKKIQEIQYEQFETLLHILKKTFIKKHKKRR